MPPAQALTSDQAIAPDDRTSGATARAADAISLYVVHQLGSPAIELIPLRARQQILVNEWDGSKQVTSDRADGQDTGFLPGTSPSIGDRSEPDRHAEVLEQGTILVDDFDREDEAPPLCPIGPAVAEPRSILRRR